MKPPTPPSQSSVPGTVMSLDTVFVLHYMDAMHSLQKTWLESDSIVDSSHFTMQVEYLIRLIPDREMQKKIIQERAELFEQFKKEHLDYPEMRAGLCVITHLVEFICNSFDLLHLDIIGPATSRQYRDAVLEIPDMVPASPPENAIPAEPSQVAADGN